MSDNFVDLVGEGIDLAVRVGEMADPTLIARRIGTTRRVTVASRRCLERRGKPVHPADLAAHLHPARHRQRMAFRRSRRGDRDCGARPVSSRQFRGGA
jgi:hypothetical protein